MVRFEIIPKFRKVHIFYISVRSICDLKELILGLNDKMAMQWIDKYRVLINNKEIVIDELNNQHLDETSIIKIEELGVSRFDKKYKQSWFTMLKAGIEWLDKHPFANPKLAMQKCSDGSLLFNDNNDARVLSKTIIDAVGSNYTDKMCEAILCHLIYIKSNGLEEYMKKMSE